MGLRDRLKRGELSGSASPATGATATSFSDLGTAVAGYQALKHGRHGKLIEKLDLSTIEKLPRAQLRDELRLILAGMLAETELPLNRQEREALIEDLLDEVTGLGPLETLLRDHSISDIL